jgi:hypothetical protein
MSSCKISITTNTSRSKLMQNKGFFERIYHSLVHVCTNINKQLGEEQTLKKLNLIELATYMKQNNEEQVEEEQSRRTSLGCGLSQTYWITRLFRLL